MPEGADGKTSFTPDADLQPTTRFYWRARMTQGTTVSEWSPVGKFRSKLVGFIRDGALFDPLIHGETVGERIGSTTFIPGKGLRLNTDNSFVRYRLPRAVMSGEYSMDVEGLAANGPGDKAKVFGMQEGTSDFITNDYRVDIQYRGVKGHPANAISVAGDLRRWRRRRRAVRNQHVPPARRRCASCTRRRPITGSSPTARRSG